MYCNYCIRLLDSFDRANHLPMYYQNLWADAFTVMQVSIAKQLKTVLGIDDQTKIGFLVHVSMS